MEPLIAANIVIGDRNYRIKVRAEDEEVVRKSVKSINDKIVEFKTNFAGKDMQDYIAMVLIWFATEKGAGSLTELEEDNLNDRLQALEKMLDEAGA